MSIKGFLWTIGLSFIGYLSGCSGSDDDKKSNSSETNAVEQNSIKIPRMENNLVNSQKTGIVKKIKKSLKELQIPEAVKNLLPEQKPTQITNNYVIYETNDNRIYKFNPFEFMKDLELCEKDADFVGVAVGEVDDRLNQIYDECRDIMFSKLNGDFQAENRIFIDCVTRNGINENMRQYIEIKRDPSVLAWRNYHFYERLQ
ncbi:hypothetical protein [Sulfurimonas sp. RIFOXYB12_FULL_35_9]|uniref:hypothetical protein n=1 Tax=Sulfurimonas sp. RIFOXYB12_FULL_35_9 TaxID=1802256 RepID=UPI0008CF533B|nr:hypothetical protein [Sulfurimonas sp. RIFOXYB12_FULL_35_9]OHE03659.1 MAG: hypothetical protein A2345_04730 [Sulfurimonas sp. RIFOXYB12_FULL_35_9]